MVFHDGWIPTRRFSTEYAWMRLDWRAFSIRRRSGGSFGWTRRWLGTCLVCPSIHLPCLSFLALFVPEGWRGTCTFVACYLFYCHWFWCLSHTRVVTVSGRPLQHAFRRSSSTVLRSWLCGRLGTCSDEDLHPNSSEETPCVARWGSLVRRGRFLVGVGNESDEFGWQ